MAVVATVELQHQGPGGGAAGQAQGSHDGFGARADKAYLVEGGARSSTGEGVDDAAGQLQLAGAAGAEGEAIGGRFLDGLYHPGVGVSQDQRAPGQAEVHELVAIGVPEAGAGGALEVDGRAADGTEGAHGAGDAAGHQGAGAGEESGGVGTCFHGAWVG